MVFDKSWPLFELVESEPAIVPPPKKRQPGERTTADAWGPWIPPITIIGVAVALIALVMLLHFSLSNRLLGVETTLANLGGRLDPIFNQYNQTFKKVAQKQGFGDEVSIIPIASERERGGAQRLVVRAAGEKVSYSLVYELVRFTGSSLTFVLNGKIGSSIVRDNQITIPLKLNEPVQLSGIGAPGVPTLYIEVIALPSAETGNATVLAFGPKPNSSTKSPTT